MCCRENSPAQQYGVIHRRRQPVVLLLILGKEFYAGRVRNPMRWREISIPRKYHQLLSLWQGYRYLQKIQPFSHGVALYML